MRIQSNTDDIIKRLQDINRRAAPQSTELRSAFQLIGNHVSSLARLNVSNKRIVDTGNLMKRLFWRYVNDGKSHGVQVGPFGVPYAAVHEFGFRGTVNVKPHTRLITQAFGRRITPTVVTVGGHMMRMNIRARPYLRPAVRASRTYIADMLRLALQYVKR